jgi:DNA-binding NarL/FixJ family response regulator
MKILVVDDHVLIREALRGLFKELKPDATVLEASDAARTVQLLADQPDVELILLDLSLPDRDGFALLTEVRERYPGIAVVVLSGFPDRANVLRALDRGALGFIPKSAGREVMMSALNLVFSGGVYVPPEVLGSRKPDETKPAPRRRRKAACIAGRPGIDRTADRCAGADDARQEQQGDLPPARSRRTNSEEPRHRHSEGVEGFEPHRSGPRRVGAGLGAQRAARRS